MNGDERDKNGGAAPVKSFEDLRVYQAARQLTVRIYEITQSAPFSRDHGLADQIRRASVSVMSNIAEGFERDSRAEFIQYLRIAKGSCGEVRAQITIAGDLRYLDKQTHEALQTDTRHIAGMLANLISHLKTHPGKGTRNRSSTDSTP